MGIAGALAALLVAGPVNVMDAGGGNALTLPAARHLVRLDPQNGKPATWLLAVQQDGAAGHWLSFYRSDDEAQSWSWYAPIQDSCCERDTPDMLVVGMDVALVYSYEGPEITGSVDHDVYFQWWRWDGNANWNPTPPVKVFDSTSSSTAYLRGEIAIDSLARIWIWAQRLNSDGSFTMSMSVSTDRGVSFAEQPTMDTFADRPGGRIIPVSGNQLMLLYGTHGVDPGYMRMRSDGDPVGSWSGPQVVFPEGLYHGAALSAASDGSGGVHLVYKDVNEQLWYRHWSGGWSGPTLVESSADWALQPAITRVGGDLVIFWNRMLSSNTNYQFYYQILEAGSFGNPQLLDDSGGFKGYPAAAEVLPTSVPQVPCFYGNTPDANSSGSVALVFAPTPNATPPPPPPPPPDGGTADAGTDAGTTDGGTTDAGIADAGTDGGVTDGGTFTTGVLFSDNFNRTVSSGLGSSWQVTSGLWRDDGQRANSDLDGSPDRISVIGLSCADCSVQAAVVNFSATTAALDLREAASGDRYDLALTSAGRLQIRRHKGGTTTVLGDVASGIADLGNWATIALSATGAGPVQLVASVNGVPKLSVTDTSASALKGAGTAGLWTDLAGIWFDDFVVTGNADSGGTPDAGTPDAGTPDAGTPDAGTTDAGTPDAGTSDAGTPDAGSGGGTGPKLAVQATYQSVDFDLLAVDGAGTAYGVNLNGSDLQIYASPDGRNWTPRGSANGTFWIITALSDGTLLADLDEGGGHVLSRSTDHGATWTDVLVTGSYRTLTPHSFAELDGAVFYIEYQVFTTDSTPIRLWKSNDRGATWFVQFTFQGHRHAHGMMPDPSRHALFAFFGDFDVQSGLYRSTDGGASWTRIKGGTQAGDIVDGVVLDDGSFLCGQDISYQGSIPNQPQIANIALDGSETDFVTLPSASYSTHAVRSTGGYVVGTTHEEGADVEAPGWTNGTLWSSGDGTSWQQVLTISQASPNDDVRADVYWELPSGELVLTVRNAAGFGPGGRGYLLLKPSRM